MASLTTSETPSDTVQSAGRGAADLILAGIGPWTVAFASVQVAGVTIYPSRLPWPCGPDGRLGALPAPGRTAEVPVVDLPTCLERRNATGARLPTGSDPGSPRTRPRFLIIVTGGVLALPVDHYALGAHPVYATTDVLRGRGVYALTPIGDGYAVVLDLSYLVALLR